MTKKEHRNGIGSSRKILFLAVLAAFGPAQAQDADVAALTNPDTAVVSGGVGWASGDPEDRALFGQYNGWRTNDVNLLLDFLYLKRNDQGVWTRIEGRNLGLDVLDFGMSGGRQGDWKLSLDYDQMVRRDPYTINTGMGGVGTTAPAIGNSLVAPGAGGNIDLSQKRKGLTLGGSKWITPNFAFEANYKIEEKNGSRLWGVGGYCSNAISPVCTGASGTVGALYLTPEPIDSTAQQFEAKFTFFGDGFGATAGYYGSYFDNSNSVMTPAFPFGAATVTNTGNTLGPLAANLGQPVALPPGNQANQFYLSGYGVLPLNTRINFKASYTLATQDDGYPGALLAGAAPGAGNLGGEVETTAAPGRPHLASAAQPQHQRQRALRGPGGQDRSRQLRRGDRTERCTPTGRTPPTSATPSWRPPTRWRNVARAMIGVDYANIARDRPVGTTWIPNTSMAAMRESNNETGIYAELRRSMSETFNAALSYRHAEREGYHWYGINPATGYAFVRFDSLSDSTGIFPWIMLDRTRDTVKLTADWTPTAAFSLNLSLEDGRDSYDGPAQGRLHDTDYQLYNIDAAWRLSDNWKMTGYATWGKQTLNMQQAIGYAADLEQENTAVGLGVVGTVKAGIEVGADLSYVEDKNSYDLGMTTGVPVSNLPDNTYRATLLKLWGTYAIDKKSGLRFDLIQQWADYNDWAWGYNGVPFAYSDNTTVTMQPSQDVTYVGVRYVYRFR